jgi:ADP-ribosylation factor-like protein 1
MPPRLDIDCSMGAILSILWERESKIVIIGLNNSGKTSVLYRLSLGVLVKAQPTIGSNMEELRMQSLKIAAWDVGGGENMRRAWLSYFEDIDGLVFLVDSSDINQVELAKVELFNAILSPDTFGVPLLVLANKQDLPGALPVDKLSSDLELTAVRNQSWHIQPCSAVTGSGLSEGLEWLAARITERVSIMGKIRNVLGIETRE